MSLTMFEAVDVPYYFGIGGIGDFLLLMSTFYDKIERCEINVFFVANNPKPIKELSHLFPKVRKFFVFPKAAFEISTNIWEKLENETELGYCLGTGVTPKNFHYVVEWIKCGQTSNVFDYYGVVQRPLWAFSFGMCNGATTIQPFGGANDPSNVREMSKVELQKLIDETPRPFCLVGSPADKIRFEKMNVKRCDDSKIEFITDTVEMFTTIQHAKNHIGVDSWGKTIAGLAGVPTTIYKSQYPVPVEQMFGHGKDPSNYVFLDGWGFDYAER